MQYKANTPREYILQLPEARQKPFSKLRDVIQQNLPEGFEETMTYGMITYVVPQGDYRFI